MNKKIIIGIIAVILLSSFVVATDLAEYPKPFITDGEWTGLIVIGSEAEVSDMIGAIDVAATIPSEAIISDIRDEKKVSGTQEFTDTVASKLLIATSEHLENALASNTITNEYGTFAYDQKIELPASTVQYIIDPDNSTDIPAFYLKLDQGSTPYLYRLSFSPALQLTHKTASDKDISDYLKGLKDETLTILGKEYMVVNAEHTALNNVKLTLTDVLVQDTLLDGETKEYGINDTEYEVALDFVSSTDAVFIVNGESTGEMKDGDIRKLSDGMRISVSERTVAATSIAPIISETSASEPMTINPAHSPSVIKGLGYSAKSFANTELDSRITAIIPIIIFLSIFN